MDSILGSSHLFTFSKSFPTKTTGTHRVPRDTYEQGLMQRFHQIQDAGPLDGCNSWSWWWSLGFVLVVYRGCQVNSSISRLVRLPMARIGCNLGIWATHHFETLREETQHFFWHYRKELLQMELFVLTSVVFFVRKGFCVEFWLVIVFYKNMLFPNFHPRPLCSRSPPKKKHAAGATQTAGRTMPTKFCRALDVIEFLHVSWFRSMFLGNPGCVMVCDSGCFGGECFCF